MSRVLKFARLTRRQRRLLVETVLALVRARILLVLLPFRRLKPQLCKLPDAEERDLSVRAQACAEVAAAIEVASPHMPWKVNCFQRGIAAQAMLRRRGVGATLIYGARSEVDKGVEAHVWVRDGDTEIIGGDGSGYCVVARYPETK